MAQWQCPKCEGGFPEPQRDTVKDEGGLKHEVGKCPWCGQVIGGYDPTKARVFGE